MEEVRNYGKIVYIKNIFEMAGGRMHVIFSMCILFSMCIFIYLFISMFEEKQTRRSRCLILTTSWSFAPPRRAFFMIIVYYQYILFFMGRQ